MIDTFSILLSHALLLLTAWRLLGRADLDQEAPPEPVEEPAGFAAKRRKAARAGGGRGDGDA